MEELMQECQIWEECINKILLRVILEKGFKCKTLSPFLIGKIAEYLGKAEGIAVHSFARNSRTGKIYAGAELFD